MAINCFPPLPVFNPEKDGNPFAWIVRTAPKVRAERLQRVIVETVAKRVALQHQGQSKP